MKFRTAIVGMMALTVALATAMTSATAQPAAAGNDGNARRSARPLAGNVVVPQARAMSAVRGQAVAITGIEVGVVIVEQMATTTMDISLQNPVRRDLEAELLVPVPAGAVVRAFDFQGEGAEPSTELLPAREARQIYDSIVQTMRDPALLEFVGYNLVRSSVFPVPALGTQKLRLTYEHLLHADGGCVDYILPRTESLDHRVPWKISVKLRSQREITAVYSPSHPLVTQRVGNELSIKLDESGATLPGTFRLSYLFPEGPLGATVFAYPDPKIGGGYFLVVAGLAASQADTQRTPMRREVTIVIDKSGSMRGEKMDQAREAALQVLEGLEMGEAFNIIAYSSSVDQFAAAPVVKTPESIASARQYIARIIASGGTNIYDALRLALAQEPTPEMLPLVLFLTDGVPTVGTTSEVGIREVATKHNPHNRRIFSFGVGFDVNTPLLEKVANDTRATATFVLPNEDVEVKVGQVFRRLAGPVLAAPTLVAVDADGQPIPSRVSEVQPRMLPDLFDGDQLVVVGKYTGTEPIGFYIRGNHLGTPRTFAFTASLGKASPRNGFVARLWASRQIAALIDEIRQLGADASVGARGMNQSARGPNRPQPASPADPRVRELVTEIVRLSTEFGILTEYTAFLARVGSDLSTPDDILRQAEGNLRERGMNTRSGVGAVNQSMNNQAQMQRGWNDARNSYYDQNMNRVEVTGVQQINDRAFFRRDGRWIDGNALNAAATAPGNASADGPAANAGQSRGAASAAIVPDRTVEFGSEEYRTLLDRLVATGNQGAMALSGDIVIVLDGQTILVTGIPGPAAPDGGNAAENSNTPAAPDDAQPGGENRRGIERNNDNGHRNRR